MNSRCHDKDLEKCAVMGQDNSGELAQIGMETVFITLGSPWENGYIESFDGKLRDEVPNREIFDMLMEAWVLMER